MNKIETIVDKWLTVPESNAAGRLGLYRIIFAISYLFLISQPAARFAELSKAPANAWYPTPILIWTQGPPSGDFLAGLMLIHTLAIILLIVGWRVRLVTLVALIAGTAIGALSIGVGGHIDHSKTFLMVYIPFLMLFAPWGETFSLDAVLRQRRGETPTDPTDDSFRYSWVFRAMLWWLAIMFMISGLLKAIPPGQWLTDLELMHKLMLDHNRTRQDYLTYVIAWMPLVPLLMQMGALAFETFHPLVLINSAWRRFYLSITVLFHYFTQLTLGIGFITMMPVYLFFFDIYAVYKRFFPHVVLRPFAAVFSKLPSWALVALTWVFALGTLWAFNTGHVWRGIQQVWRVTVGMNAVTVGAILATYGMATGLLWLFRAYREGRLFKMDV